MKSTILFVDIETVSAAPVYQELSPERQQLRDHKSQYFNQQQQTSAQRYQQKAWIYAEFGKIVCISIGKIIQEQGETRTLKLKSRTGHNEYQLLTSWINDLKSYLYDHQTKLCWHNIKEFDLPRITRRMIVHSIPIPPILDLQGKKPREVWHIDTMEMRKCGDHKHYTSLNLLAHLFGLPTPKDDISGADIWRVYREEKDLDRISHYCQKDVFTTANLYMKITNQNSIEQNTTS